MDKAADAVKPIHPSPFSSSILEFIAKSGLLPYRGRLIDPFAGIGRVHRLGTKTLKTYGVELEPEWAACHPNTVCGNAMDLPFPDEYFDVCVTSPCYGNRMSDHHIATDGSSRRSYTHDLQRMTGDLGRELHPENAGAMYAWQPVYWDLHRRAWAEVFRVLRPGSKFLLNVSDFFRDGELVRVARSHAIEATMIGFDLKEEHKVATPRMRKGENSELRASYEVILELRRP